MSRIKNEDKIMNKTKKHEIKKIKIAKSCFFSKVQYKSSKTYQRMIVRKYLYDKWEW